MVEHASFYVICPQCGETIAFQGCDIQYYKPNGAEFQNTEYSQQDGTMDTGKMIACPHCEDTFKATDGKFIVNDF